MMMMTEEGATTSCGGDDDEEEGAGVLGNVDGRETAHTPLVCPGLSIGPCDGGTGGNCCPVLIECHFGRPHQNHSGKKCLHFPWGVHCRRGTSGNEFLARLTFRVAQIIYRASRHEHCRSEAQMGSTSPPTLASVIRSCWDECGYYGMVIHKCHRRWLLC